MNRIPETEIGFAIVKRPFTSLGRSFKNGDEIEREFLLKMPRGNRDAMSDSRQIEIYRKTPGRKLSGVDVSTIDGAEIELHLRAAGIGVYDVIKGVVVASGLSKEAAQAVIDAKPQPTKKDAQATPPEAPDSKRKPRKAPKRAKKAKKAKKARSSKPRSTPKKAAEPKAAAPAAEEANGPIE